MIEIWDALRKCRTFIKCYSKIPRVRVYLLQSIDVCISYRFKQGIEVYCFPQVSLGKEEHENKQIPFLPSSLNTLLFPKQLDGALSFLINWKPFYELVNKLGKEAINIQSVLKWLMKHIFSMTEPLMREDEVEGRWTGCDLIGDLSGRNSQ